MYREQRQNVLFVSILFPAKEHENSVHQPIPLQPGVAWKCSEKRFRGAAVYFIAGKNI